MAIVTEVQRHGICNMCQSTKTVHGTASSSLPELAPLVRKGCATLGYCWKYTRGTRQCCEPTSTSGLYHILAGLHRHLHGILRRSTRIGLQISRLTLWRPRFHVKPRHGTALFASGTRRSTAMYTTTHHATQHNTRSPGLMTDSVPLHSSSTALPGMLPLPLPHLRLTPSHALRFSNCVTNSAGRP